MNGHEPRDALPPSELDTLMGILSAQQRRLVLYALGRDTREDGSDPIVRGQEQPGQRDIELHHVHLPKLDEAGYIEWDRKTGDVQPGARYDDIEPLLELIEAHSDELPPDPS